MKRAERTASVKAITLTLLNDKGAWLFQLPRGQYRVVSNGREFLKLLKKLSPDGAKSFVAEEVWCNACDYWWVSLRQKRVAMRYRCQACGSDRTRVSLHGWH